MAADNNDFTHEFQIYSTDLNAGTIGTGKFLLFDNNINAVKVESIDNIKIGGGEEGQVLVTDGAGNLTWATSSGGGGVAVNADWNSSSGASRILNKPDLTAYLPKSGGTLTGKLNAAQGAGTTGGYSFGGTEGGADTGMFSNADGILDFYADNIKIVTVTTSGVTSTQAITLPGNPTSNLQAATKQYVDSAVGALNNFSGNYNDLTNKPTVATSAYIGTTQVAFNRASGNLTLTGVSIDGNAATVSNGVYTNGSYSNPIWITSLAYSKLTDAPSLADVATSGSYDDLINKPTIPSLDGYATEAWVNSQGFGSGSGGTSYNQSLNTTDDVTFNTATITNASGIENADGQRITNTYYNGTMLVGSNLTQTPVSILMGGAGPRNEWQFTPDGNLTLPRNADQVTTTDPIVRIGGGTNPQISSTNSDETGPADFGIQANTLNISGYNGNKVSVHADDGSITADVNLVLKSNNTGSTFDWTFDNLGNLTLPAGGDIKDSNGNSVLGGGGGATALSGLTDVALEGPIEGSVLTWNESQQKWENRDIPTPSQIINSDENNTYSVSVSTNGVVTMNTARGSIEFGAQPEEGAPQHLHIMRPAGAEGSTDLYFGDDYNYVKMPALYGPGTQGVEIGSSYNSGAVSTWRFNPNGILTFPNAGGGTDLGSQSQDGTFIISNPGNIILNNSGGTWTFGADGHLILPTGGDIRDITGTSVLGGSGSANTGNISFSGDEITGTAGVAKMQVLDVNQIASYSFTPGVDYSTAVWENDYIVFNDPTQAIYDAIWALTNVSTIQVQVAGNWTTVTSTGSSTPGMPLAPTLFINQTAVGGPLNIDIVDITINQGTTSYVEISGTDFRVDVQDDIRMYGNDAFRLINRSTTNGIEIQTANGDHIWEFNPDGTLTLPSSGDILRNGNSVIPNLATVATTGNYNDLDYKPDLSTKEITHESNVLAGPTNTGDGSSIQITDDYQTEKVLISNLFGDVARATLPNVSGYGKIVILVTSSPQATYVDRGRWNGSIGYVGVSNSSNGVVILMSLGSNGWKQIQTND